MRLTYSFAVDEEENKAAWQLILSDPWLGNNRAAALVLAWRIGRALEGAYGLRIGKGQVIRDAVLY